MDYSKNILQVLYIKNLKIIKFNSFFSYKFMSKQKIVCVSSCVICVIASFLLGAFIGCNYCCHHKKDARYKKIISFYSVKKHIGEKMSEDEQKAVKIFVNGFEDCLMETLDNGEKKDLETIKNDVLNLSKENTKVIVNIEDLKTKNAPVVVKKTRKCIKKTKQHMTKMDKRLLNKGISKMKIEDIISMFHGIR